MGETSKRLQKKLKRMARPLDLPTSNMPGQAGMPSVQGIINQGLDPIHAAYVFIQNITSYFAESVSELPEMKEYAKLAGAAEDDYMPQGPPMSPLTGSYFTSWAFFDLRFGGSDTLGTCLIDANDVVWMSPDQLDALRKLSDSRMGIYEHLGIERAHVRLRELITGDEFVCLSSSGYQGAKSELWYVRLLPPLLPEMATYHVVFTTPYILIRSTRADWESYLRRTMLTLDLEDEREALRRLMKFGLNLHQWNEFVFEAYHHHQYDAIFLAGIPDRKETLPHAAL